MNVTEANKLFDSLIDKYHILDDVDQNFENIHPAKSIDALLYHKCWIDTVQWHLEDIIRDPNINAENALKIKRRIDASNQERTDMVEYIDSYFLDLYKNTVVKENATINTESPAWSIDRLSILALKIYHMNQEVNRTDATKEHLDKCNTKLAILLEQRVDLTTAIQQLLNDIEKGDKFMKVYKQMKMYNDVDLNPVLYAKK